MAQVRTIKAIPNKIDKSANVANLFQGPRKRSRTTHTQQQVGNVRSYNDPSRGCSLGSKEAVTQYPLRSAHAGLFCCAPLRAPC